MENYFNILHNYILQRKSLSLFIICFAFHINSCQHSVSSDFQPQIVFGEHIEGIRIGDDSATILSKLGTPSYIGDGDFKGYIFYYTEGRLANTFVTVSKDTLFGLGAISVNVEGPYKGKTKDEIGISSERDFVIRKMGISDTTYGQPPLTYDIYYFKKNGFGITYENQIIHRISMSKPKR